jgi:cell division protein FtsW
LPVAGLGLAMVLSSSAVTAFRSRADVFAVFGNQAVYAVVGLLGFGVAMLVLMRWVRRSAFPAVLVSIALLAAVLVPGVGAQYNGARSWLVLGSLSVQPSELAKLALLLWTGQVLAARRNLLRSPRMVLLPVLPVFVLMVVLVVVEPSLGTAVVMGIVFLAVLFFAGAPRWMFTGIAGAAVVGVIFLASSAGYRAARVTAFLDPQGHPELTYQVTQGMYALSDGGLFGIGLGHSMAKGGGCRTRTRISSSRCWGRSWAWPGPPWCWCCSPCWPVPGCGSPGATSTRSSRSPPRRARSGWSVKR